MSKKNQDLKQIYEYAASSDEQFFTYPSTVESVGIFKELDSWEGLRVLEIGCGTGQLASMIATAGASSVLAFDYSENSIETAKSTYNLGNLEFLCQDANDYVPQQKFDVVVLQGVLEHLDDPFISLDIFKTKFLKEDGILITSCPSFHNPRGFVWMTLALLFEVPMSLTDLHFLSIDEFKDFAVTHELSLTWKSIHQDWGCGEGMIKDFSKEIEKCFTRCRDA